ncbi:MAG: carbohydrate ABC transporter permease [Clostridiales bacterium]|nr:carbohydrate ABC transporter permease [Clostridiales bacterium]
MAYKRSAGSVASDAAIYLALGLFALLCLYPFWYLVIYTISDPGQVSRGITLLPRGLSLYNIQQVLRLKGIGLSLVNSVLRTVVGTGLTVISCSFLGYVFTKEEMPARRFIYRALIVTMYVSGGLIPTYLMMRAYGLLNTFSVYVLPSAVSAYNVILIKTYIEQLPASLEEAAMIDGAGYFTVFTRVIFPLSIPIVATIAIFAAVGQWNSWFDNHIYNQGSPGLMTLQYQLYKFLNEAQRIAELLKQGNIKDVESAVTNQLTPKGVRITTTLFAALPIFLVYPLMQRYFIKGIMIGAVKG